jgi:peptide-methionine (S)-S-oxide reductase
MQPPGRSLTLLWHQEQDYHQQYLHKVPNGYCGLGGTGVSCPIGLGAAAGGQQ